MVTKANARKTAQRKIVADRCEDCGSTENLQRHHPDHNEPLKVRVLCQPCHTAADMKAGTWGRGSKKSKQCIICGKEFIPNHSKKHNTCSKECLSEAGRRNAAKRTYCGNKYSQRKSAIGPDAG